MSSFPKMFYSLIFSVFCFSQMPFFSYASETDAGLSGGKTPKKVAYILTVDGGGVRGAIPAKILDLLEESLEAVVNIGNTSGNRYEVTLAELFDVMAGTSTGGIITISLNSRIEANGGRPKKASEVAQFYKTHADKIFPKPGVIQKLKTYVPKVGSSLYSQVPLAELLRENLGEVWLKDGVTDLLVPSFDMRQGMAYCFSSGEARNIGSANFKAYEVALATSAAPTYFDSIEIQDERGDERLFSDGGTYANNPTLEAIQRVDQLYPGCDIFVISLGTGTTPLGSLGHLRSAGKVEWVANIAGLLMNNAEGRHQQALDSLVKSMISQGRNVEVCRINPIIDSSISGLDDADNIKELMAIGMRVANKLNREEYPSFERAVVELARVYKEKQSKDTKKK